MFNPHKTLQRFNATPLVIDWNTGGLSSNDPDAISHFASSVKGQKHGSTWQTEVLRILNSAATI